MIKKDLSDKTLGIIHAAVFASGMVQKYINEIIPEVQVVHLGDDTVQRDNLAAKPGVIPKGNYYKFITYAHFLEEAGANLILLGCSTFNSAVEVARPAINVPLLQIDRPMMDLAVQNGKKIGMLATLPSTVPSSERLLRQAARDAEKEIEIQTVLATEAFKELQKGNQEKHNEMLLKEIDKLSDSVDVIVMAQVSMSVLEPFLHKTKVPVYNSGRIGITKVKGILESL